MFMNFVKSLFKKESVKRKILNHMFMGNIHFFYSIIDIKYIKAV